MDSPLWQASSEAADPSFDVIDEAVTSAGLTNECVVATEEQCVETPSPDAADATVMEATDGLVICTKGSAGKWHAGGLGRRALKTLLAILMICYAKRLLASGEITDRGQWWSARDFWAADSKLHCRYRRPNALGDALGNGRGAEGGMGMTRDAAKRIPPSRENAAKAVAHLRNAGWDDDRIAGIVGMTSAEFHGWAASLPADADLLALAR
jgi:hypothetical protein